MMTTEDRTILLGHAADLERYPHGLPQVADIIRRAVVLADSVPDLQATIADLRKGISGRGTE